MIQSASIKTRLRQMQFITCLATIRKQANGSHVCTIPSISFPMELSKPPDGGH